MTPIRQGPTAARVLLDLTFSAFRGLHASRASAARREHSTAAAAAVTE